MRKSARRDLALEYAKEGYPIFPCRGKQPLAGSKGFYDATTDLAQISEWWSERPNLNIALRTGASSNRVVVDYDKDAERKPQRWQNAPMARTPHGGAHSYYEWSGTDLGSSEDKGHSNIDVRGEKGYAILSGSALPDGDWRWVAKSNLAKARPMPDELLTYLERRRAGSGRENGSEAGKTLLTAPGQVAGAAVGDRHAANKDVIVSMRLAGASTERIEAVIRDLCANYAPPLSEQRIEDEVRMARESANWNLSHEARVLKEVETTRARRQARLIVDSEEAQLELPPLPVMTLREELELPEADEAYAVDGLGVEDGNVLIPAMRKAGKTTLLTCNLARSLVDGVNFLDRFEVRQLKGSVVVLSYEMTRAASLRWMRAAEVSNAEQISFWHLRGHPLPFWLPEVRRSVAGWLRSVECEALIIEPAGRAAVGLVRNHNDRAQVDAFTAAVDALKMEAGVRECYMSIHMGWSSVKADDDEAHALGSEAWEAWADAIWPYEKDKSGARMLRAFGRDVDVEAFTLRYNRQTHVLSAGATREEHREMVGVRLVCEALALMPSDEPPNTTQLKAALKRVDNNAKAAMILAAEEGGYIKRELMPPNGAKLSSLTESGRKLISARVG